MIALIFTWILLFTVFFTFGRAVVQLWKYVSKSNDCTSPLDVVMVGMCATTSVIAVFSLWMPANTMLLFALAFICIFYWLCNNKSIPILVNKVIDFVTIQPKLHLLMYAIAIIALAMFCTLHPTMTDTLYYHIQNIMWNEQYSIVPGLANLQPRFAFNSSYFLLASTFGLKPLFGQYIFGGHTFFLVAIYVWTLYKSINSKKIIRSAVALVMMTCFFVIYKVHITSVTTDFFPNLLIIYLILKVIFDRHAIDKNPLLYVVLPIFIITLKLSCFSIVIFPLYVLWKYLKTKEIKVSGLLILFGLAIVVPWCVRTVILSGYLLFPIPYFDFFDFDWKIPIEYVVEQKEFIQSFARYPNNIDIATVLSMPISEWFPIWWESDMQYYNPVANRVFSFLTVIFIPVGAFLFIKYRKAQGMGNIFLVWLATLIGIVVWFFNAPDFRFIYSLIIGQTFIVILILLESLIDEKKIKNTVEHLRLQVVLTIITIIFVALYSGRWVYYQKGESVSFMKLIEVPSSIAHTRELKGVPEGPFDSVEVNGIQIRRMSASDRDVLCLDCDLPCSADYVGGIEMRGKTLQEGFRCRPDAPRRLTY